MKKDSLGKEISPWIALLMVVGLFFLGGACLGGAAAIFAFFADPHAVIHGIPIAVYAIGGVIAWIILFKMRK